MATVRFFAFAVAFASTAVTVRLLSHEEDRPAEAAQCPAQPMLSPYLKRIYRVSLALSAALFDKVVRQEAPSILEAMGFEYVTVGPDANCKFLQLSPTEIRMSLSMVSLQYKKISLGTNITLSLTISLGNDGLHFRDVGVDSKRDAPPTNSTDSKIWSSFRKSMAPATDAILSFAANKGLGAFKLNSFTRNLCLHNKGRNFNLRISEFVVDDYGDVGIGLTFHEAGCEGEWKAVLAPMLNISQDENLLQWVALGLEGNYIGTDLPPSERSRLAIFFEDGFIEKLSGDRSLGIAVDGALKVHGLNPLAHVVASSETGRVAFAQILNTVLTWLGVAQRPRLSDVRGHWYRLFQGRGQWMPVMAGSDTVGVALSDASFGVIDITNQGLSLIDSLFSELERQAMFAGSVGEKGEKPVTLGECS